ncbi:MAG: hypothetical protein ACI3XJ_11185 [Oscillospiraceae bacterium]
MKKKTISGHYGTTYSIKHNNREFVPNNVDPNRIYRNYNCIAVGHEAFPDGKRPVNIAELWERYRYISQIYWEQRDLYQIMEVEKIKEALYETRRLCYSLYSVPNDPLLLFLKLLALPLIIPCGIVVSACQKQIREELESERFQQWVRDQRFKCARTSAREALRSYDSEYGTRLLAGMDNLVESMAVMDEVGFFHVVGREDDKDIVEPLPPPKFATVEQIYEKCFEPSFRKYQETLRPCRRYEGTYLEQIRERQAKAVKSKGSKNEKSRVVAEAIEIVFGIGDMDNTGYAAAPMDAQQSEVLLKDFCDYLLTNPHLCYITTEELDDPNWQPPFRNGLIILNLTVHCDEATPGVHLTCIPYSRGCKRGPDVQASLGRALTGMGYPSTWQQVLDKDGNPIPKTDRKGNVIKNDDGSIRYKQEPAGQGIIDWIEDQKLWLGKEMQKRYGWEREYKGSHPRGNLTTADYKVARAMERLADTQHAVQTNLHAYENRVHELTCQLERAVSVNWDDAVERDVVLQYLVACPDEEYEKLVGEAVSFLEQLPSRERTTEIQHLQDLLRAAQEKAESQNKCQRPNEKGEHGR